MKKLILISHGSFCEGIKNSVEMIFGAQDYIYTVALTPEQGQETFEKNFKALIEDDDDVVVFADLQGGTPANTVSKLIMQGAKYQLYTGINLPMIIAYINAQMIGQPADIAQKAKDGIIDVNALLAHDDDEE